MADKFNFTVKYRILSVDTNEHSIVVRYFTDNITEEKLATSYDSNNAIVLTANGYPVSCRTDYNINIFRTSPQPTSDDIQDIILHSAPVDWLRLQEDIANTKIDTSLSLIQNLENTVGEFDPNILVPVNEAVNPFESEDIETII